MSTSVPQTARAGRPWRFLDRVEIPTPEGQREMALECAAARVLHRVALLRAPFKIPPLLDFCRKQGLRLTVPVPVHRLVPIALVLCKADGDGHVCDAAMQWLADQAETPARSHVLREAERTRGRWIRARTSMVRANLRLAAAITVKRYAGSPMAQDDVFQEAVFGLSSAADRFDPNYGVKFSTYATWWIRHAIQRAHQNTQRLVRIPAHMCDKLARYAAAQRELGERASDEALADRMSIPLDDVRRLARVHSSQVPISLDGSPSGGELPGDTFADRLPSDDDLEAALNEADLGRVLARLVRDLPPRTRGIFTMRFGLEGGQPMTLQEIGERFGLSRERVRQIQTTTITRLASRAHSRA